MGERSDQTMFLGDVMAQRAISSKESVDQEERPKPHYTCKCGFQRGALT